MPRKAPCFTLHLSACPAFTKPTQQALGEIFGQGPQEGLHAIVMLGRGVSNSRQPAEVGFLFEDEEGFHISSAFKAPAHILKRGAAAAFHVSNDPNVESLEAACRVSSFHLHTRCAVSARGAVSWRPMSVHASRGAEDAYEEELAKGQHIQGLVADRGTRSAHQLIEDHAVFASLASAAYQAEMAKLPKSRRVGLHRQAEFKLAAAIRNSDRHFA